jgi:hypothetical protein
MSAKFKLRIALLGSIFVKSLLMAPSAFAITAEVAKNCSALATKAYPLRYPGNPAGGRVNGTGADFQKYFSKCVANGGNMPEQAPKHDSTQSTPAPNQSGSSGVQVPK